MPKLHVPRHEVVQPADPSYRLIPLTQGRNAIVDTEDYDWLSRWNWCAWWSKGSRSFYPKATVNGKLILMHRLILRCGPREEGDHRNHDTLDNRKGNLRKCNRGQNARNGRKPTTNRSGV